MRQVFCCPSLNGRSDGFRATFMRPPAKRGRRPKLEANQMAGVWTLDLEAKKGPQRRTSSNNSGGEIPAERTSNFPLPPPSPVLYLLVLCADRQVHTSERNRSVDKEQLEKSSGKTRQNGGQISRSQGKKTFPIISL